MFSAQTIRQGGVFVIVFAGIEVVMAKTHVVRLTPKLEQEGFRADLNLGEVVAEQVVASPAECGRLCEENLACGSVMLMGRLCRMLSLNGCVSVVCLLDVYIMKERKQLGWN